MARLRRPTGSAGLLHSRTSSEDVTERVRDVSGEIDVLFTMYDERAISL